MQSSVLNVMQKKERLYQNLRGYILKRSVIIKRKEQANMTQNRKHMKRGCRERRKTQTIIRDKFSQPLPLKFFLQSFQKLKF